MFSDTKMLSVVKLESSRGLNMKGTLLQRNTQSSFLINSPQTKDGYRALVWNARPAIQLDRCSLLSHVYPIPKHSAHTDVHALVQLEGTRMISSVPTAP